MKKNFRLTTLVICIATFIASLVLSVFFYVNPVRAAAGTTFEMEYGAGVKLGKNGLRFIAKMDADYYNWIVENDNVKLYGYIAPTEEFDKVDEYKDLAVKVGGVLDENKIYQDDGFYKVNIALTGLDEVKMDDKYLYGRSFSAIIFIVEETGGTPNYVYADLAKGDGDNSVSDITLQNRTQYQVVNSALLDTRVSNEEEIMSTYGSWYGANNEFPIVLSSQEEITAFTNKIANSVNFANAVKEKIVYIKNGLSSTSISGKVATINTGYRVNFWDGNKLLKTEYVANGGNATDFVPTRTGYEFVSWTGDSLESVTEDRDIYAKWKGSKGEKTDIGDLTVYGVTRADGANISTDADVIGQRVVLAGGDLGNGAYAPGETNGNPDPIDENNTANQAFLAFDGNYGFNDYFVADFTGKNMPTMAFFANNYNHSIFYGDGTKDGVIVATGLTHGDGRTFTEDAAYSTSVFNGKGLCMWGPHMIYNTGSNAEPTNKGVLLHANEENVALGRENLVAGKKYRIIMGFVPGDDPVNYAIKLIYTLYDLDSNSVVESKAINTYNFFADGWANDGQTRDEFCQGSIVAYGYFGTKTVLDKVYDIYEDTNIGAIASELGLPSSVDGTLSGDAITLGEGTIGIGANYTVGQNAGGTVSQSYYAINGEYSFNDYIVLDFTGKNMPEVMFFAKNYDTSMYYTAGKQGVVVASGITLYNGTTGSAQTNNTMVGVSGPFGAYFEEAAAPHGGNMLSDFSAKLARENLADGVQYRVIMGIEKATDSRAFTLHYVLYNLTDGAIVEEVTQTTWNFFGGDNASVGNMRRDQLVGSIVLYGKFSTTCTIDKLHGVYENTDIDQIISALEMDTREVEFVNYDGSVLQSDEVSVGVVPAYVGATPKKPGDAIFSSYTFKGWDKEISAVTEETEKTTYTAVFIGENKRDYVTFSGDANHTYGVEQSDNKIVLKASGIGDGANYTLGQNNGGYVHQSYLAFDGNYALNDYVAFEFTGKNLPEIAFFANNYNDSMYADGTNKEGIVVVTGITTYNGALGSGVNGNGTQINYGFPYMIQNATDGGFVSGAFAESALGRANLVDGTHYRVIMGFTGSGNAITLHWHLYNLDTNVVVEQSSMQTWNFFDGANAKVGNKKITDLSGSIVLYGKFGVACELDKIYGVFEDTDIDTITNGLNGSSTYTVEFTDAEGNVLQSNALAYGAYPSFNGSEPQKAPSVVYKYNFDGWDKGLAPIVGNVTYTATFASEERDDVTSSNVTENGDQIVLGAGNIGAGADYTKGQNAGGSITQSYLAFDGEYSFNDYIVFDFTGKNMPEVMFFGKNYDTSMYYTEGKQGVVVASGITFWNGTTGTAQTNNTMVGVSGPFGAYFEEAAAPHGGNMLQDFSAQLARSNLADGVQYRIIMGIEKATDSRAFTLHYVLYNLTDGAIVEEVTQTSWNFFGGDNASVGNMLRDQLVGSIVLYGKFNTTCTIDNFGGIYTESTMEEVTSKVIDSEESGGDSGEEGEGDEIENPSTAPDYSKYTDQFDFYAYNSYSDGTYEIGGQEYYIGKTLANLKQYSLYGEVGMTIYFPQRDALIDGSEESLVRAKKLIDDLAKVGITKTILNDSRITYLSLLEDGLPADYDTDAELDAYIYKCMKDYATYPGVYGIMLGDEPKYVCLSAYSSVYNSIKRVCAANGWNLFIQYNLNPLNVTETVYTNYYPATSGTYAWGNYRYDWGIRDRFTDTVTRYTQYINDFLNAMNPDSITYDDYPLMINEDGDYEIKDSYIPCLQIVAKAAADRGIKFYHVTQAYENNAEGMIHRRAVTEKGAKWLNNILLGFGTKQIAYYTYYTRSESDASGAESYVDGSSFVDYNGNPTTFYYWMQKIMANNQKFAPTIMQFDYKGSKVYGSTNYNHLGEITVSNSFTKLSSVTTTSSTLVTELYDDENANYMYMAMNVLDPDLSDTAQTVTMTFSGYNNVLVYVDGVATSYALSSNKYTASLTPGEAVYVIPYN